MYIFTVTNYDTHLPGGSDVFRLLPKLKRIIFPSSRGTNTYSSKRQNFHWYTHVKIFWNAYSYSNTQTYFGCRPSIIKHREHFIKLGDNWTNWKSTSFPPSIHEDSDGRRLRNSSLEIRLGIICQLLILSINTSFMGPLVRLSAAAAA